MGVNNKIIVSKNNKDLRLDSFLIRLFPDMSKSLIQSFIRKRKIRVNERRISLASHRLKEGDQITYYFVPIRTTNEDSYESVTDTANYIYYEDEDILVVYKEYGVLIHSAPDSLDRRIEKYLLSKGKKVVDQAFKVGHVHRIDRETKGLVMYAKNREAQQHLYQALENRKILKKYIAIIPKSDTYKIKKQTIVSGYIEYEDGVVMGVYSQRRSYSKYAEISVKKIRTLVNQFDVLEIDMHTGRKHQIRALLQNNNTPIVFDRKYGNYKCNNILLFCYYLELPQIDKKHKSNLIVNVGMEVVIKKAIRIIKQNMSAK